MGCDHLGLLWFSFVLVAAVILGRALLRYLDIDGEEEQQRRDRCAAEELDRLASRILDERKEMDK